MHCDGKKYSHKLGWLRIRSPQRAVIPTLLIKILATPFLVRWPFSSKGPRHFTSNLRSLNTPPAIAANEPLLPGRAQNFWFLCKARKSRQAVGVVHSEWPAQATEDSYFGTNGFFPGRGLLLSCLSVAGGKGGFCILGKCSPRGLQSWEKGCVRNKLEFHRADRVPSCRYKRALTFLLGPRAARQEGRCVSVLSAF